MLREFLIVLMQLTLLALAVATGLWLIGVPLAWVFGIVGVVWVVVILSWLFMGFTVFLGGDW
jgi:hypothetical protein